MTAGTQKKIILYVVAAIIAIIVNIGSQWIIVQLFGRHIYVVYGSILFGTGAGLVAKYIMDKLIIFEDTSDANQIAKQFVFYTLTGVVTTLIFWGVELLFHLMFDAEAMRYVGGAVGLTIGYCLKFILDSKFVFVAAQDTNK